MPVCEDDDQGLGQDRVSVIPEGSVGSVQDVADVSSSQVDATMGNTIADQLPTTTDTGSRDSRIREGVESSRVDDPSQAVVHHR